MRLQRVRESAPGMPKCPLRRIWHLMTVIGDAFTEDLIDLNPYDCISIAKLSVMSNRSLRSQFCLFAVVMTLAIKKISTQAINMAFDTIVLKACHCQFGVVFC